ncbi:hypothetical protein L0F63_001653 [Massospora cicadina]|nr:hypothetical protein L0F63_001653 [Massospora cicadina]
MADLHTSDVLEFQRNADIQDMRMPVGVRLEGLWNVWMLGKGYEPAYDYLSETLASMARFHDPDGLFEARNGRARSPHRHPRSNQAGAGTPKEPVSPTGQFRWLVTPRSLYGKRMHYAIKEYAKLLDSSNITIKDWIRMATDIETYYPHFDAFIILHGTDTMAYTASALSFMLENLGKTVIITGSQVPISEVRNDAVENILGALTIAGHFIIPEVALFFGNKLYRGNRCSKVSAIDFEAFDSPNLRPLALAGVNIEIDWAEVLGPHAISSFRAHKVMNPNVATLRLFPGITEGTIKAFLGHGVEGVVLETYGSGNVPERPDLLLALKEASAHGVVIVNCTQCRKGMVSDSYACSKGLLEANVVPGIDMTPEVRCASLNSNPQCALTKLSYLLAKGHSPEEVRFLMRQNLRGELTGKLLFVSPEKAEQDSESKSALFNLVSQLSKLDFMSAVGQKAEGKEAKLLLPLLMCSAAATNDVASLKQLQRAYRDHFQPNSADYSGKLPIVSGNGGANLKAHREFQRLRRGGGVSSPKRRQPTRLGPGGPHPLFYAVIGRHASVIRLLVDAGAHFNCAELRGVTHRFLLCAAEGNFNGLQCFIDAGLDVNVTDTNQRNALHIAASHGHLQTVKFLCGHPIDLSATDRRGNTPLDNARATLASFHHRKDLQDLVTFLEGQLAAP